MLWRRSAPKDIDEHIRLNDRLQPNDSEEGEQLDPELPQPLQSFDRRGLFVTCIIQGLCFLWVPAILTFVVLNFVQHLVGATVWCLGRHCYVELFNPVISVPISNLQHFDERDHDVLGVLQLISKVAEIWFGFIAAALVSLITFRIAERKKGLSIGLITRPYEFADLLSLLDRSLWKAGKRLFCFTGVICIVCNLMGPAIAVLIIPHLRWIDTEEIGDRTFRSVGAADPPMASIDNYFWDSTTNDCSSDSFDNLSFSCAANPHASELDSWIGTYLADPWGDGLTQERGVKFRVNQTFAASSPHFTENQQYSALTWWAPCRQLLRSLGDDLDMVRTISGGATAPELDKLYVNETGDFLLIDPPDTYYRYNDTLRLILERNGPILGAIVQMHWAFEDNSTWTSIVDDERSIRCFRDYDLYFAPLSYNTSQGTYTKCVRTGKGWTQDNKQANFTIAGEHNATTNLTSPHVEVSIFSSDKAQFFKNAQYPSYLPAECLAPGRISSTLDCDWERLFHTEADADLYNRTQNVLSIEMSTENTKADDTATPYFKLTVDFVAFLNFTPYQLDASPLSNPMVLATTQDLPLHGTSVRIDPAWMLAAWTVDNNGVLTSDRTATIETVRTLNRIHTFDWMDTQQSSDLVDRLGYISLLPVVQALSLVDFATDAHGSAKAARNAADKDTHPHLTRRAHIYLWAYGLDSRTGKFGVTVVFCGIVIVLAQVVLGFVDRKKPGSLTQLIVAALKDVPRGEVNETTRFRVQRDANEGGKYLVSRV